MSRTRAHPKRLDYSHGTLVMPGEPAFSPDGRVLATNGGGSGVLWNVTDPARLTEIAVLPGRDVGQGAMVFSPDGRILATTDNGEVVLWNIADPARATRITILTGQAGDVTALSFSPDGHLLASGSDNGTVVLWNLTDPARATPHHRPRPPGRRHFRPVVHPGRASAGQRQRRRHGDLAEPHRPGRAGHHRHAAVHRPAPPPQ